MFFSLSDVNEKNIYFCAHLHRIFHYLVEQLPRGNLLRLWLVCSGLHKTRKHIFVAVFKGILPWRRPKLMNQLSLDFETLDDHHATCSVETYHKTTFTGADFSK